jgi:hypothetical protein
MNEKTSKKVVGQPQGSKPNRLGSPLFAGAARNFMNVLRRVIVGASVRLLPRRVVNGVEIVAFSGTDDPEQHFARIAAALELVHAYWPSRFARLTRDLKRIALVGRGGEVYDHGLKTYMVDLQVLQRRSIEEVGMAIVHEATHARLWNCNIKTTRDREARVEALCVAQEVEFAARLPNGSSLIENARRKLSQPWWGEAAQETRLEDQLVSLHVPSWLIALRRLIRKHFARGSA